MTTMESLHATEYCKLTVFSLRLRHCWVSSRTFTWKSPSSRRRRRAGLSNDVTCEPPAAAEAALPALSRLAHWAMADWARSTRTWCTARSAPASSRHQHIAFLLYFNTTPILHKLTWAVKPTLKPSSTFQLSNVKKNCKMAFSASLDQAHHGHIMQMPVTFSCVY